MHFVAPGRHDLNYFTVLGAGRRRRAARARARTGRSRSARSRSPRPSLFFSFVPANGDSALFFDRYMIPVDAGVPRRRRSPAVSRSRAGRARWRCVALVLLVAGLLADRASLRRTTTATPCTGSGRRGHAGRALASRRARSSSARRERRGALLLVVRLRPPGEHPRPPRRAPRVLGSSSSTTTRASARSRSCTGPSGKRYGVWLFYAASRGGGDARRARRARRRSRSRATTSSCGRARPERRAR